MYAQQRKIILCSSGARETSDGEIARSPTTESTTDLESTYHEVLRNISHGLPHLVASNVGVTTLSPYMIQVMKNLRQVPAATIRTAADDGAEKKKPSLPSNARPSYTASALKKKQLLLKKYTQPSRTTAPSEDEESRLDEAAAGIGESTTSPEEHPRVGTSPSGKPRQKNGPSTVEPSASVSPHPTKKSGNRREWHVGGSTVQVSSPSPLGPRPNNRVSHADGSSKKQPSLPSALNSLHLPSLKYSKVPRPFSKSALEPPRLLNVAGTTNIATSYRQPSPTDVAHQVVHPAHTVLPLVLPTDLFSAPPARRYVPIKRANREFKGSTGIHTAATSLANADSPGTSPKGKETAVASGSPGRSALYAVGATNSPAVATNKPRSDLYVIAENPTERRIATTTRTYTPGQPTAPLILQRRLEQPQDIALTAGLAYDALGKSNANPGVALYNKFAGLYSVPTVDVANVLHVSKAIAQEYENFKQPPAASALPHVTLKPVPLKPIPPALLRPVAPVAKPLAPYYDGSLLLAQHADGREIGKGDVENGGANGRSHAEDEGDGTEDKGALGSYRTQVNHGAYETREGARATPAAAHETRETPGKQPRVEGPDPERSRVRDKYRERHDESDGKDGGSDSETVRDGEDEDDEEDVDETREDEYVKYRRNKDENEDRGDRYQYGQYKHGDSEEEAGKRQRHDTDRYDDERTSSRGKYDRDVGANRKLTGGSGYSDREESADDDEYLGGYEQQESARDARYDEKSRRHRGGHEEDASATEDESAARRSEDQGAHGQRDRHQKKRKDNADRREYLYGYLSGPRATDPHRREELKREEFGETKPKHVREEYQHRQHRVKDHRRDPKREDDGSKNLGGEEERDHVHGETQEHAHKHEEHHDDKKHGGDHKYEAGEGGEHEKEHHAHEGEKGDKVSGPFSPLFASGRMNFG